MPTPSRLQVTAPCEVDRQSRSARPRWLIPVTMALIFAFDVITPLGVAGGVPYVLPVWLAASSGERRPTRMCVLACLALVGLGMLLSPAAGGAEQWKVVANRLLAAFAILVAGGASWWLPRETRERLRFPAIVYAGPLLIFLILLAGSGVVYSELVSQQADTDLELRFQRLRGEVLLRDEALTMSARLAAATGNENWTRRYEEHALQMDQALEQLSAIEARLDGGDRTAAAEISAANATLLELERAAFELAAAGRFEAATDGLESAAYRAQKARIALGLDTLLQRIETSSSEARAARATRLTFLQVVVVVGLGICFWISVLTVRSVAGWRRSEEEYAEQLSVAYADLEHTNKDLEEFAFVASHDLRSPLRAIDNLAAWVCEDAAEALPTESVEHLEKMRGRILRMNRLLDDLLEYSRVGRTHGKVATVDTRELLTNVIGLLDVPAGFHVSLEGTFPVLTTHTTPLETCLRNLVGNAIKHHDRASGSVEVSARDLGDRVVFRVRDDGPGIPPQYHERIFELFQTLERRDKAESSGLGLAMIRKSARLEGGEIEVDSAGPRGTTFELTWPKRAAERAPREGGRPRARQRASS